MLNPVSTGKPSPNRFIEELQEEPSDENHNREHDEDPRNDD
jgi:hypothetical protein